MQGRMTTLAARVLTAWAFFCVAAAAQEPAPGNPAVRPQQRRPAAAPAAQPAAAPAAQPADPARMEWLLKQWEHQSSLLKTLDVAILRIDDEPAWGDKDYYEGRALFKSPNLAWIDFNKIKLDDKKKPIKDAKANRWVSTPHERIICTGTEVWQYKSDTHQIAVFPLQKDQQKKAIEEGPLPFLFNMRADDAKHRYQMNLMSEDEKSFGVSIKPKLQEDKESFSLAFVNLDRKYLLPVRILMISPDGKSTKDYRLGPVAANQPVNEKNFEGKPLGPPWKVSYNPGGEDRPRASAPRSRRAGEPTDPSAARSRGAATKRE